MPDITPITNDRISVKVSSLGAEMQSLTDSRGQGFLWNGDAAWWSGRSPILFPIVGKTPDDVLEISGKSFPMKQHGFARRSEFSLVEATRTACRHRLVASDETRAIYPYEFQLDVEHRLHESTLTITATVTNRGDTPMLYGIGFHPAFLWPLPGGEGRPHTIILDNGGVPSLLRLADGLVCPDQRPSPFATGRLMLAPDLFEDDAMIFPEGAGTGLTYAAEGGPSLHFTFENLPNIALWQKPGAPFVCIEPWHGMAARVGGTAELAERPFTVTLASGENARYGFSVELPDQRP
ncbi:MULTISPECIES: aldose 1-epimerase family protein [Alphaproteobacteria]|uniref:Aldose 1-epimerase n=2 Tax=Alphaproteobacteria TaxID=28211 RepID=A0A512HEZ5_9HYPH|nr:MULTISPECIES: aldose 1-epimerase family protein [Alphaproteobacteria]GEO84018.1 aldose 1-epimerase [Ciceribacter naphthalenivorans]GLR21104.1 aldose 1-epimerase [Ciceribacter naphthalenivorans]GLT03960.1 aldose 1-epimerase [Sphingomonas psychrolutea]